MSDRRQSTDHSEHDCRAQEDECAPHPASVIGKSPPYGRSPPEGNAGRRGYRQRAKSDGSDGTRRRVIGHPQTAGCNEQQDADGLHTSQASVPGRNHSSESIADKHRAEKERRGTRDQMCVESPPVCAPEMPFPPAQEVRIKIRRNVVSIFDQNAQGHFPDQQCCQDCEHSR